MTTVSDVRSITSSRPMHRRLRGRGVQTLTLLTSLAAWGQALPAQSTLPDRLTDVEFWKLVTDFSEPAGYFRSENFTSNETGFQWVIPELLRTTKPGGVYMGVGPEQNFTYIVALKPKMAFITDIRRQNMLQHLIYKVLMEQNDNRADFLSHLFSRPRPAGLDTNSTPQALFNAYQTQGDAALHKANLANILEQLTKKHGFTLSDSDVAIIGHVVTVFYQAGPNINYSSTEYGNTSFGGGGGRGNTVTYATLMGQDDGRGVNRSYLATEANYRQLRDMEIRNMLVPVVGDFGGPTALRAVGNYVREHKATVTAMYCSNVEQYLFSNVPPGWQQFYTTIGTLPLDSVSTFIRTPGSGGLGGGRGGGGRGAGGRGGSGQVTLLASMQALSAAFKAGQINSHADVLAMAHPGN